MESIEDEKKLLLKLTQFKSLVSNEKSISKNDIEFIRGLDLSYKLNSSSNFLQEPSGAVIGGILLHLAYEKKHREVFNALIIRGADFNAKDKSGCTVLHKSFQTFTTLTESLNWNNKKHLQDLIDTECLFMDSLLSAHVKYSNPSNISNPDGLTHFHIACTSKRVDAIKLFLTNGVPVDQAVSSNRFEKFTPLHFAVRYYCYEVADLLLKNGANVSSKNARGMTPLHVCVEQNIAYIDRATTFSELVHKNEAVMNLLLRHQDDVDAEFPHLYVFSAMRDSVQAENFLIQGNDVNQCISMDSQIWPGYTALHFAAHVNVDTVILLMKHGANILATAGHGVTALDMCFDRYAVEDIVDVINLIPTWKDILLSDGETKFTDLLSAFKDSEGIRDFWQKSKSKERLFTQPLQSPSWPGYTPLQLAVLLSERARCKSNYRVRQGLACFEPDLGVLTEMLDQGADANALGAGGCTSVHLAFRYGRARVASLLLERDPTRDCADEENLTHLHVACTTGNRALVEKLLRHGADVDAAFRGNSLGLSSLCRGWTPLHVSASRGDCELARLLLEFGANPHAADAWSWTPVHGLVAHAHPLSFALGRILLASPDLRDRVAGGLGLSYLHVACWTRNVVAVRRLLDQGVDVNRVFVYHAVEFGDFVSKVVGVEAYGGGTPLHFALGNSVSSASLKSKSARLEIVKLLLERGADLLVENSSGVSSLSIMLGLENYVDVLAAALRSDRVLRERVEAELGLTLLHLACRRLDVELVDELLPSRVAVDARIRENSSVWPGYTPLHVLMCIRSRDPAFDEIARLLLYCGADVTLSNARRVTPLHAAHRMFCADPDDASLALTKYLLKAHENFEINPTTSEGISHFHIACHALNVEAVEGFLEHGVDVDAAVDVSCSCNLAACSPLLFATKAVHLTHGNATRLSLAETFAQLEVVGLLVKHGASVNVEDMAGNTPLHYAALTRSRKDYLLQLLIRSGANVHAKNVRGQTPLELLLTNDTSSVEEIRYFIASGCRFNAFNSTTGVGYIALATSTISNNELQNLLFGTFLNFPELMKLDDTKRTAIHNIVSVKVWEIDGAIEQVNLFDACKRFGCDIDYQDYLGRTALHLAAQFRNVSAVSGLLLAGADINITDRRGKTPFAYLFEPCFQCKRADNNRNQYYQYHFVLSKRFVIQIRKLKAYELEVNEMNQTLYDKACEEFPGIANNHDDTLALVAQMTQLKIKPYELALGDFVIGSRAVLDYPTMSLVKREAIDEFFETNRNHFHEAFKDAVGIFRLQYRQAVLRRKIINEARDSLFALMKFRLPDICSHIILRFLKNSDLQKMILSLKIVEKSSK